MEPERRRSPRLAVDGAASGGVLRAGVPVALRDISAGGLCLRLPSSLDPGEIHSLTLLLRGLSLATPVRITRCGRGEAGPGPAAARDAGWEAGAEFLWRDASDAAAVRGWLEGRLSRAS